MKNLPKLNSIDDFYLLVDIEDQLPEDMWEMLDKGYTVGIFQIEDGKDAKSLCRQIRPRSLEEIALITALNRPGILKAGAHVRYIEGRNGNPRPSLHPLVAKVTPDSFGEIIYQEQLIAFFEELGYDKLEADDIRKATGKKLRDEMKKIRTLYAQRFAEKGAEPETIDKVWKIVEGFADYAFNKAHSVEYGLITLWTLFAKWSNPEAFILGSMRTLVAQGHKEQVPRYVREAVRMGIPILGPDLNKSKADTSIHEGAIRYGFADVKGIGRTAANWIVNNRPFESFEDMETRSKEDDAKITLRSGIRKVAIHSGQIDSLRTLAWAEGQDLIEAQEKLLGVVLDDPSTKILAQYAEEIAEECVPLEETYNPGIYTIAGVITNIKNTKTRKGDPMAWVTIENNGDERELSVWSTELDRLAFIWRRHTAVVAKIKVTARGANIMSAKALYDKDSEVMYGGNR